MDAHSLDFWLGSWRCTWDDGEGSNSITRMLDDAVVLERFEARGDEPFHGMSISVFDAEQGLAADLGRFERELLGLRGRPQRRRRPLLRDARTGRRGAPVQAYGVHGHLGRRVRVAVGILPRRADLDPAVGDRLPACVIAPSGKTDRPDRREEGRRIVGPWAVEQRFEPFGRQQVDGIGGFG